METELRVNQTKVYVFDEQVKLSDSSINTQESLVAFKGIDSESSVLVLFGDLFLSGFYL